MEEFRITGVREIQEHLLGKIAKVDLAATRIVQRSQSFVERNIKKQFTGAHPRGTPTVSAPGEPPSVVTGALRRSVVSERVQHLGFSEAKGRVYPTVVYARIQELGGGYLPARPYVAPGLADSLADLASIAIEEWAKAV